MLRSLRIDEYDPALRGGVIDKVMRQGQMVVYAREKVIEKDNINKVKEFIRENVLGQFDPELMYNKFIANCTMVYYMVGYQFSQDSGALRHVKEELKNLYQVATPMQEQLKDIEARLDVEDEIRRQQKMFTKA